MAKPWTLVVRFASNHNLQLSLVQEKRYEVTNKLDFPHVFLQFCMGQNALNSALKWLNLGRLICIKPQRKTIIGPRETF